MPFHLRPENQTTRRGFLAGVALGGATIGIGRASAIETGSTGWMALVSDTHIDADPAAISRKQAMADNLKVVVADILASPDKPVGMLINGDLAKTDGQPGDYRTLLALLEPIRKAEIPIHFTLGNHDDRHHFRNALKAVLTTDPQVEDKFVDAFQILGHRFLLLDSLDKVNHVEGLLGTTQLAWLAKELDRDKTLPSLIFVHHNPVSASGAPGLVDASALFDTVKGRPWVKAVVYGHTHTWATSRARGVPLVNLPPVGYTFAEGQPIGYCRLEVGGKQSGVRLRATGGEKLKDGEMCVFSQ